MALPTSGQISFSNLRTELGIPSQAPFSITSAATGGYVTINQSSPSKPNSTAPHAISEWYGYNHTFSAARSIAIALTVASGTTTLTAFKNGVSYLTRTTTGNAFGSITPGDTFAGRITRSSLTTVDLEVFSTTRGGLYAVYDSGLTLNSPTFTLQSGEDINIYGLIQSSCLVAGTLITLHNNTQVSIETLKVGDILKSVQIEGLEDTNDVIELKKWESNNLTTLDTYSKVSEISKETVPVIVTFNKGLLRGSTRHVQLVKREGEWRFLRFGEIKVGDIFINENQEEIEIQTVDIEITPTEVYRVVLEVPSHTFYANNVLTHNIK